MRITAHLDTEVIGLDDGQSMLDGPLSWAWAMRARSRGDTMPPITRDVAPDFPLPLAKWKRDSFWGWKASRAHPDIVAHTHADLRRKPATAAMSRWTTDRKHHLGLGPMKARNVILAPVWAPTIWWDADITDRDDLADLLRLVTHLGKHHNIGFGHVTGWDIDPDIEGGWADRPMPPDAPSRAPYWHHSRKEPDLTHAS